MIKKFFIVFTIFGLLYACSNTGNKHEKATVTVSVVPQKFFVDRIAGSWLEVNVMVPVGASPATYEPTPMQMKSLSHSRAYFKIGHIGFEKAWMHKLESLNPAMKVIDTSKDLELIVEEEFDTKHTDDHGHSHSHEGYNPHIWLSPKLVKSQAKVIFKSLCDMYPNYKQEMTQNLAVFIQQIDSTELELNHQLLNAQGTPFIVYHPVWNYLARDYNLNQISIEHNGKEASANKLKTIIDFAKEKNIKIIFAQKEFNGSQAKSIAEEINGKVVFLNPLEYNWFAIMNEFTSVFSTEAGEIEKDN